MEHKPFRHSTMRSGSSSSSSRFKIRPKQVNASTCDFEVLSPVWRQHRDTLTRFEESYMSTKATAARIYEYGEPDVFRFETMDVERRHHERCVAWRAWRRSWRGRRELDIIRP